MLTKYETKIIKLLSIGATNTDIAEIEQTTNEDVKAILNRLYKKLNVSNRVEAIIVCLKTGHLK